MDGEKRTLIEASIKRGDTKYKTRDELVSQGYATEGFDLLYATALTHLRVQQPKEKMSTSLLVTGEMPLSNRFEKKRVHIYRSYSIKMMLFLLLCAVVLWFGVRELYPIISKDAVSTEIDLWGKRVEKGVGINPLNATDSLLQTKVESTAASANLFVGRMGFFEGVCKDISVVSPVQCSESATGFAIFTRLSNGSFYCVDRAGFRGVLEENFFVPGVCKNP